MSQNPYSMKIYVDGGSRGNGSSNPIGAAAAVQILGTGGRRIWTRKLLPYPTPTNQRAEITAIILALESLMATYNLSGATINIHSDSRYAIGCMTEWIHNWQQNGWRNANGEPVVNQDLIVEACNLDDEVKQQAAHVEYIWVPRERNMVANRCVNEELDIMDGSADSAYPGAEEYHY